MTRVLICGSRGWTDRYPIFEVLAEQFDPKRTRTRPIKARSGDIDKLLRSILDSLTGPLLADDSQVIASVPFKDWGDPPGVVVEIYTEDEFDTLEWSPAPLPQDVGAGLMAEQYSYEEVPA